ncbi:hypothetical protein K440DRAFT_616004 [Wilcoxina mikolae CBS 423.85]|nr:hypothetical protein K440DRAFT_616004 [Wilcoxina mikolae CBS 423.85]
MSLLSLPNGLQVAIIDFLPTARDVASLRLANRELAALARPRLYHHFYTGDEQPTRRVRQLLRLIHRDRSLAAHIGSASMTWDVDGCREYGEESESESESDSDSGDEAVKGYTTAELLKDYAVWESTTRVLGPTRSQYMDPRKYPTSRSKAYDNVCVPLLLCQLPNLRTLRVSTGASRFAAFATEPAIRIWGLNPLYSLQTLFWTSTDTENGFHINHILPLLVGAPRLQVLHAEYACAHWPDDHPEIWMRASEKWLTTFMGGRKMEFLTEIEFLNCSISGAWFTWFFGYTPKLTRFAYRHCETDHSPSFSAPEFQKALRVVRDTLEEIQIENEAFEPVGSIGPFTDFPRLKSIKTDFSLLVAEEKTKAKLVDVLAPGLETLCLVNEIHSDSMFFTQLAEVVETKGKGLMKELVEVKTESSHDHGEEELLKTGLEVACDEFGVRLG